jgi:pimeloyl-ACP methyl ester carboxylesterase
MHVYLFSGLGADASAFQNLLLPSQYQCKHINYIAPKKKETLAAYAFRIAKQIDQSAPYALIGLSFGGILVMELLQFLQPAKTIIISSTRNELPFLYKLGGLLQLHKIIPSRKVNRPNWFTYWLFGVKSKKDKALLAAILARSNTAFTKWAIHEIVCWKRTKSQEGIWRIHGTRDRILPVKKTKVDFVIDKGGHLLIIQYGKEVSEIVTNILNK